MRWLNGTMIMRSFPIPWPDKYSGEMISAHAHKVGSKGLPRNRERTRRGKYTDENKKKMQ